MGLVNGNVLITGATGGIGQAIARAFAARGAKLTLTGRRVDVLESLAGELGGRAIACDLSVREDVARLLDTAPQVDVLVANAAVPATGAVTELTQEQIDRMLEVNLRAPIALARGVTAAMIERGRGHVVFVSSLVGKSVWAGTAMYAATKIGLRGFALGLREDLRGDGVGVSVILPGFIRDAGMFADAGVSLPPWVGTRSPEDVAAAALRAIERNRAEIEVAPTGLRVGANIASVAPQLSVTVGRRLGGERIAGDLVARQVHKR